MGHMRRLALSCNKGRGVTVSNTMLDKWRVAQHWIYEHQEVLKR